MEPAGSMPMASLASATALAMGSAGSRESSSLMRRTFCAMDRRRGPPGGDGAADADVDGAADADADGADAGATGVATTRPWPCVKGVWATAAATAALRCACSATASGSVPLTSRISSCSAVSPACQPGCPSSAERSLKSREPSTMPTLPRHWSLLRTWLGLGLGLGLGFGFGFEFGFGFGLGFGVRVRVRVTTPNPKPLVALAHRRLHDDRYELVRPLGALGVLELLLALVLQPYVLSAATICDAGCNHM
eukprot:scaffold49608_cov69-Phaeocystis_antarctica.AAC.3